jgi:hypothetical protein
MDPLLGRLEALELQLRTLQRRASDLGAMSAFYWFMP